MQADYLEELFEFCAYDACALPDETHSQVCTAFEDFARECWEREIDISGWREHTNCRKFSTFFYYPPVDLHADFISFSALVCCAIYQNFIFIRTFYGKIWKSRSFEFSLNGTEI